LSLKKKKNDLWDVLEDYPKAKALLIERGKEILRKDLLLDEGSEKIFSQSIIVWSQ
jgi:hypothetical protein